MNITIINNNKIQHTISSEKIINISCLNKYSYKIGNINSKNYDFYYNTLESDATKCINKYCPMDICSDGKGRRPINNNCCECPSSKNILAQYKNNKKMFSESYFYGNVAATVDVNTKLPSHLNNSDTVIYFSGIIKLHTHNIPYPDSKKIINGGRMIFCIGGGNTIWGEKFAQNNECMDNESLFYASDKDAFADYYKFTTIIEEIFKKGWKGIMLDWERIDKSHTNEGLIYLLTQIKHIGNKYTKDPITMLHTTTQGPFCIDSQYKNKYNKNIIIMNNDIYKHIDYLSILLFNTTDPSNNNISPLINYNHNNLVNTLDLWTDITNIKGKVSFGKKMPYWGDGTVGTKWHYFPDSDKKLVFLLSCFDPSGLQPWPNNPPTKPFINPKNCNKPDKIIDTIKNKWKGVHYWIYK